MTACMGKTQRSSREGGDAPVPWRVVSDCQRRRGRLEAVRRREPIDELVVVEGGNQRGVDEAVRGRPGLRRDQAVQRELLLGAVHRWDVVGRVALLGVRVHLHRPVTVLWHESVDGDCLRLYPGLDEEVKRKGRKRRGRRSAAEQPLKTDERAGMFALFPSSLHKGVQRCGATCSTLMGFPWKVFTSSRRY